MTTVRNWPPATQQLLHEFLRHVEVCEACGISLLALVDRFDSPHETHPSLLHSTYNSTESAEREHPR